MINLIVSYFGNMGICQDLETIIETIRQFKDDTKYSIYFCRTWK